MLELAFLGGVAIHHDGRPLADFNSQKGRALLCYLAVTDQHHTRQSLAGLFWPDLPEANARANLRKLLSRLPGTVADHLTIGRREIGLHPERPPSVDVHLLEAGMAREADVETMRRAAAVYQGDFLESFSLLDAPPFDQWAAAQRARLRQGVVTTLRRLVAHFAEQRDVDLAIDYSRQLLEIEPWREEAERELMRLLAIAGRRSAALVQYERFRDLLQEELGIEPAEATQALYEAIKNDEVAPIAAPAPAPVDAAHNLPAPLTEFIGRGDALAQTNRTLQETRFLTVVGPGGIGKSRLAIELAADLADQFRHGVAYISLAPVPTSDGVAQAIAEAIGLSLASGEAPRQQLLNYLRPRQKLLVADNFEHVLEAAGLLEELLRGAPDLKVLVTSRIRLNLSGESVYRLGGLNTDGWEAAESALANEAIQLFLATARRARAGFRLRAADLPPLRQILERLEGSPLGILLAASWVDILSLPEIAAEIEKNVDFLEKSMRDLPERHHSVRAVFEASWRLLTPAERKLFAALSIFRGGFTRAAAEKVAGASVRQLANLADKSLLSANPRTGRYSVHELLRQYGEMSLQEDEERYTAVREAHALYFAGFMEQAWDRINHGEQPQALRDMDADIENVRAAWRFLTAEGDPQAALTMLPALWFIYDIRGWHVAGAQIFKRGMEAAASRPAREQLDVLEALCRSEYGFFRAVLGDIDGALALTKQATAALRELDAPDALGFAIAHRCVPLYFTGQLQRMKEISREALSISEDRWIRLSAYAWIANAAVMEGEHGEASEHLDNFEASIGPVQDDWLTYYLNMLRHLAAWRRGDISSSTEILEEALVSVRLIGYRRGIQYTLGQLAHVSMALEDYGAARRYILESLEVSEELGSIGEQISSLVDLASVQARVGQPEAALELAATAYAHPLSHQNTPFIIEPIRSRADAVRQSLESALKPERAAAAWERGLAADVERVVADLVDRR